MRLPNQVLNTVCFLAHDGPEIKYGGTGFIVAIKGEHNNAYLHLVTAKHVADALDGGPFVIGANTKHGTKALIDANVDGENLLKWWYHPTHPNAVDAAVTLFAPDDYEKLDVEWVFYPNMFATAEVMQKAGIGIGDEIAVVGLFTRFSGKNKHFPIVRIGNLAMLPSEPVPVEGFDPMDVYLAEGRSIGGLSGSPVYVRQTLNMEVTNEKGEKLPFAGVGQIYFLGLMHGHWRVPKQAMLAQGVEVAEAVNMGVSIVVPAHKIVEILNQPELVALRKKYDETITKDNLPVADSLLDKKKPDQSFTQADFEAALKKASRKITPNK